MLKQDIAYYALRITSLGRGIALPNVVRERNTQYVIRNSEDTLSPRSVALIVAGLVLVVAASFTDNALVMVAIAAGIVGAAVLAWLGGIRVLYVYAALIWILPRIYLPGLEAIVPLHVLVAGGVGLLWLAGRFVGGNFKFNALLPPFWPLIAVYCLGGVVAFFTGRPDVDSVNGVKFLVEACVVAPLLYLVVWHFMRDPGDAERLILLISLSTAVLSAIAFVFQGTGFWTPVPFEKEGLRLSGQYQFGGLYVIITPVLISTQLSMLIPALTSLAINSASKWRRISSLALIVPLVLTILLAAGRSGWMGTALGVMVVLFFSAHAGKISLPKVSVSIVVFAFLAVILLTSLGLVNDEVIRRLGSFGSLLEDDTVVARYGIWAWGLDLIAHYPFGVGFQVMLGLYGYPAHNQYILWALGTGLPGLFVVVLMLLGWMWRVVKSLLTRYEPVFAMALASLAGVLGGLVGINGDNISTSVGWTQGTLWILLGVGAAAFQVARAKQAVPIRD
ncbi:MAG: O-antigen ligase family protein [Chloroflexia bacterium]